MSFKKETDMNRRIILFFVITALLLGCNSKRNDWDELNLKGEVWKLKVTSFKGEEKFGKFLIGDKNHGGHRLFIFDKDGYLTEKQQSNRKGKIEKISKYNYDDSGNCIEMTTYEDDKVVERELYKIANDRMTELQVLEKDGELSEMCQFEYSGNDISSGKFFNSEGNLFMMFEYEYEKNFIKKIILKDSIGKILSFVTYERNNKGDITTEKHVSLIDSSEYVETYEYEYDYKGNYIKSYQFDKHGKIKNIFVANIVYYNELDNSRTEKDFIGMWFVIDDNNWIEFRSDKKYDLGYKERIQKTGIWEIDAEQQILTFRADEPHNSKKYKFDFEGYQMILSTIQGVEKFRLMKR